MQGPNKQTTLSSFGIGWRHVLLSFIVIGSLAFMLSMQPFGQNPDYHDFADRRAFFGIPNFFDVMSNIPFLLVGMAGMSFCFGNRLVSFRPHGLRFSQAWRLSVFYWHWFDDLRFFVWIQFIPLLTVPVVMVLFRPRYSHQWLLLVALACYMLAKLSEAYDREVFMFTQSLFSGHSFKHLLSALGCFSVVVMLKTRRPVDDESTP